MEDLIAALAGLLMDACLRALNIKVNNTKVNWGFSSEKNPILALVASAMICMVPIGLYNNFSTLSLLIFIAFFCASVFLMIIIYADYKEVKEESNILDDDFKTKR